MIVCEGGGRAIRITYSVYPIHKGLHDNYPTHFSFRMSEPFLVHITYLHHGIGSAAGTKTAFLGNITYLHHGIGSAAGTKTPFLGNIPYLNDCIGSCNVPRRSSWSTSHTSIMVSGLMTYQDGLLGQITYINDCIGSAAGTKTPILVKSYTPIMVSDLATYQDVHLGSHHMKRVQLLLRYQTSCQLYTL